MSPPGGFGLLSPFVLFRRCLRLRLRLFLPPSPPLLLPKFPKPLPQESRERKRRNPIGMGYLHSDSDSSPSPLKERIWSSNCFSCCFRGCEGRLDSPDERQPASLIRCPSAWLRSKAQELPELKERCRSLIPRMGRHRRNAGGFRYDPLSYALNFDEGNESDGDGEISLAESRYRSFSSRLPPTPPHPTPASAAAVKEIACS